MWIFTSFLPEFTVQLDTVVFISHLKLLFSVAVPNVKSNSTSVTGKRSGKQNDLKFKKKRNNSSSSPPLYILTAPAGNLLGLFKTGLKRQFSALAQLKRITSALFSASRLSNPESHVTSNYEYDFHVPLGPKFHPSKSSNSAAGETCQKQWSSSTKISLGEIKLSQPELWVPGLFLPLAYHCWHPFSPTVRKRRGQEGRWRGVPS